MRQNGPNRHTWNIPSNSTRICFLLKHTWNVIQDKSYDRSQSSLSKVKKIELILRNFSNNSGMKLEINNKNKSGILTNMWKLHNILLNNQWVKEEIKIDLETNKNGNTT